MIRLGWLCAGALGVLLACQGSRPLVISELQVEEWEAHPLSNEAHFVAVRDVILSGEILWILDGASPFLTRISLETGDVVQVGGQGDGPGEFLDPWAIQPTSDLSGILVWDFGSYRVTKFAPDGVYQSSKLMNREGRVLARSNFNEVSYGNPFRVRSTPEGYLVGSFLGLLEHTSDVSRGSLRLSDQLLTPGQEIVRLSDQVDPGVESMKEWAALPFWDQCGENLVVWKPVSREVVWMDPSGTPRARTSLEPPHDRIELQDIERYLEWMARLELGPEYRAHDLDLSTMAQRLRDRFAKEQPFVTDLRCQGDDTAWIRLFSTETDPLGKGSDWIRVDPSGPSHFMRTPVGFTPFLFTSEGSFGSMETPGGDQVIALATPSSAQRTPPN